MSHEGQSDHANTTPDVHPFQYRHRTPRRTLTVAKPSMLRPRQQVITDDSSGETLLYADTNLGLTKAVVQISLSRESHKGRIVAAARPRRFRNGCRILYGDPAGVAKEDWTLVDCEGLTNARHHFRIDGRTWVWKRTHDVALGASRLGEGDFKLVAKDADDIVVATFIENPRLLSNRHVIGKINWYDNLPERQELLFLAAILGIQERIRRLRANMAAS